MTPNAKTMAILDAMIDKAERTYRHVTALTRSHCGAEKARGVKALSYARAHLADLNTLRDRLTNE